MSSIPSVSQTSHKKNGVWKYGTLILLVVLGIWTTKSFSTIVHVKVHAAQKSYKSWTSTSTTPFTTASDSFPLPDLDNGVAYTCQLCPEADSLRNPSAPFAFIPGAMKGGTSSLMTYLSQHSMISNKNKGEDHILDGRRFEALRNNAAVTNTNFATIDVCPILQAYQDRYGQKQGQGVKQQSKLLLDKSPLYLLLSHIVPQRLLCSFPNAKIIIVLRNPVDRSYSNWGHERNLVGNKKRALFPSLEATTSYEYQQLRKFQLTDPNLTPQQEREQWSAYLSNVDMTKRESRKQRGAVPQKLSVGKMVHQQQQQQQEGEVEEPEHHRHLWTTQNITRSMPLKSYHILAKSLYAIQLRQWFAVFSDHFGPDEFLKNILILDSNAFREDPQATYDQVLDFLQLPRQTLKNTKAKHVTAYHGDTLSDASRHALEAFFLPHNAKLHELLAPYGIELSWAKEAWEQERQINIEKKNTTDGLY